MYKGEYEAPILTVDSVIFQIIEGILCVLLIKRATDPFKGAYALPGGYNPAGETTHHAMTRILSTKAGVDIKNLSLIEQLYTFDTVARDPRGHAVSVTYMGLGNNIPVRTSSTTQSPQFYDVNNLPDLTYDHADIIKYALERLQSRIGYTNAIFALLNPSFTLTQLQIAYESVLCRQLDRRNFRKKFLSLGLIKPTDKVYKEGAHRPARLYKFNKQELESLSRSFE